MGRNPGGGRGRKVRQPVCSSGVGPAAAPRSLQDREFMTPKPSPFPASASTTGAKFISPLNTSRAEQGFLKVTQVLQPSSCPGGIFSPQITGRVSQALCLQFQTVQCPQPGKLHMKPSAKDSRGCPGLGKYHLF